MELKGIHTRLSVYTVQFLCMIICKLSNFYKSECLVEKSSASTTCTRSCCYVLFFAMAVLVLQGTAGASGDDGFQGPRGAPVSALPFSA